MLVQKKPSEHSHLQVSGNDESSPLYIALAGLKLVQGTHFLSEESVQSIVYVSRGQGLALQGLQIELARK